jgi:hypothetical protein
VIKHGLRTTDQKFEKYNTDLGQHIKSFRDITWIKDNTPKALEIQHVKPIP